MPIKTFRKLPSSSSSKTTASTRTAAADTCSDNSSRGSVSSSDLYSVMSDEKLTMLLTLRGLDITGMDRERLVEEAIKGDGTCYDEAAKEVMAYVNSSHASRKNNKALDSIWKDETTGAKVYVGNAVAAANKRLLKRKKIFAIVNCQGLESLNYHEKNAKFHYHRFPVTTLAMNKENQFDAGTGAGAFDGGFRSAFSFIEQHLKRGHSVLVHCTAGAHRAGTVGVAWLMHQQSGLTAEEAIVQVKLVRPIVQPFGLLLGLLHYLEMDLALGGNKTATKTERKYERQMTAPTLIAEQTMYTVPSLSA